MSNADVTRNRSVVGRSRGMKLILRAAKVTVATPIIIGVLSAPAVRAQDATDWQTKAGGKMSFEVASVKLSKPDARQSANVPLDPSDLFLDVRTNERPNGRFSANSPLSSYVRFAYKLHLSTPAQLNQMISHLPKWVSTDVFEIQARAGELHEGSDAPDDAGAACRALSPGRSLRNAGDPCTGDDSDQTRQDRPRPSPTR
jgi:hypothetical protein